MRLTDLNDLVDGYTVGNIRRDDLTPTLPHYGRGRFDGTDAITGAAVHVADICISALNVIDVHSPSFSEFSSVGCHPHPQRPILQPSEKRMAPTLPFELGLDFILIFF